MQQPKMKPTKQKKMMFNNGAISVVIEATDAVGTKNFNEIAFKILQETLEMNDSVPSEPDKIKSIQKASVEPLRPLPPAHRDTFSSVNKERLPNPIQRNGVLIDPSDLSYEQPEKHKFLYRCPKCGQSHLVVCITFKNKEDDWKQHLVDYVTQGHCDEGFLMRNDNDDYKLVSSWKFDDTQKDVLKNFSLGLSWAPEDIRNYIEEMNRFPIGDNDVNVVLEDTAGYCPLCHQINGLEAWKDAWESPEKYFEYTKICEDCGGEVEMVQTKEEGVTVLKCAQCHKEINKIYTKENS